MVYASIGGMTLKHWTGYFKIIWPTLKVLNLAKRSKTCLHAETFRENEYLFAVSVWQSEKDMKEFAHTGLHAELMPLASKVMKSFYNHSARLDEVPDRQTSIRLWKAAVETK